MNPNDPDAMRGEQRHRVVLYLNGNSPTAGLISLGRGLKAIGYGLGTIGIGIFFAAALVVNYLNGGMS